MARPRTAQERRIRKQRRDIPALSRKCAAIFIGTLLWLSCVVSPAFPAPQGKPSEYTVKAVYLFNFGKFVAWPAASSSPNPGGPFFICILGEDPFGSILDGILRGETINGQPLVARRIDGVENAAACRILFVASSEQEHLSAILNALQNRPILTVSDLPAFCKLGGMIQFVIEKNTVRFQINLTPATKTGLMLSSQLLKVAQSVQGAPGARP